MTNCVVCSKDADTSDWDIETLSCKSCNVTDKFDSIIGKLNLDELRVLRGLYEYDVLHTFF